MTTAEQSLYVDTINNMTNRLKYYGSADINRISFYKLAIKYRSTVRASDVDANGEDLGRKLDLLIKRVETDCNDLRRIG